MEFRRVDSLPPYVFAVIRDLTLELRRAGDDVVDLGFGNPDLPSPELAVEKLGEAAQNPRNHRYSASKGIPNLRLAAATLYKRKFGAVPSRLSWRLAGGVRSGRSGVYRSERE